MKIFKRIIIILISIIIIFLLIFLTRDAVIRHDFITKIQLVNYTEYILTLSVNNKKSAIYYYTPDFVAMRKYDDNNELNSQITVFDYEKCIEYHYNMDTNEITTSALTSARDTHVNNTTLLNLLKHGNIYDKKSFKYNGIETINNRECHVLEFKGKEGITTAYLDKERFYTVKMDHYISSIDKDINDTTINKHIVWDYEIDFDLKQKDLFNVNIEK